MDLSLSTLPAPVRLAILLTLINAVVSLAFVFITPDLEDRGAMIVVGFIFTAVFFAACWFAATAPRWGSIGLIVINALNIALALPFFADPDETFLVVGASLSIALSLAAIALLFLPEARAHRRSPTGTVTA
ncbi:MAG: hypothetical protein IT302_03755 [Dehalococcoidia bacterium]|nr:hypothetical protein [Dehalococcoidia bacterium]